MGNYAIGIGSLANSNYDIDYTGADLTITPLAVTVTADAKSKYCGQIDPALTFVSVPAVGSTLANGQVISFAGALSRLPGESASGSPFTILKNTLNNSNYSISYKSANFTINGISIDASASSAPVPTGSAALLSATVSSVVPGNLSGIPVVFTLNNGNGGITTYNTATNNSGLATFSVSGLAVEVYKVDAVAGSGCATATAYLAVYDPNGGFVTGGGWINSPITDLKFMKVAGKANFGFVSKYKKGSNVPDGNTEFQFQEGNLNFSSSAYDPGSLVIAGSQAIYKGSGTIKGFPGTYNFMVSAVDGGVSGGDGYDKFRIKIWNSDGVVYDNNKGLVDNGTPGDVTKLGGGSIVIHKDGNKAAFIPVEVPVFAVEPTIKAYPNPFTERLNIEFSSATDGMAKLEIYGVTGAKLATLWDAPVSGGVLNKVEYLPNLVSSQMVFYHLTMDGKTQVGKVVFQERR